MQPNSDSLVLKFQSIIILNGSFFHNLFQQIICFYSQIKSDTSIQQFFNENQVLLHIIVLAEVSDTQFSS